MYVYIPLVCIPWSVRVVYSAVFSNSRLYDMQFTVRVGTVYRFQQPQHPVAGGNNSIRVTPQAASRVEQWRGTNVWIILLSWIFVEVVRTSDTSRSRSCRSYRLSIS